MCSSRIIPYFRNLGVTLGDLKAVHIQAFYREQLERVKPNTVIHYHAVIHRALKYAVKTDLIDVNPADKVDRPKKNEFTGNFYSKDEMNALFDAVRGSKIEVAVNHPTWAQVMAARNRKTLVVCRECHVAIHNGTINKPLS